jgi:hypothetical protein
MAVTLGQLKRNLRTVPVEYMGLTINVTYRPSEITPSFGRDLGPEDSVLVVLLCKALVSWDVFEDDEMKVMLPIVPENLSGSGLGSGFLNAIVQAITLDSMVGKANGAISDVG